MIESLSVYTIIPARGGSSRLPRKNIYPVWGQPMLYWAIQACKKSRYIDRYFVSTEDAEIADIASSLGAEVVDRPKSLADDLTFKQDVIVHAASVIPDKPDIVVSLQPNSPQVCAHDLDAAIEKLVTNNRNEIFSVNEELLQNAAFRIMKYDYVFQKSISTTSGVYVAKYVDVHTQKDVKYLEKFGRPCEHYEETDDV
jgi:CMP-N-acetylneuraminic acid synthetase